MRRRCIAWVILICVPACFDDRVDIDVERHCDSDDDCLTDQQCNTSRLRCVAAGSDIDAPTALSIRFEPPAAATGVVELLIEASEPLLSSQQVLVGFAAGSATLPFGPAQIDGQRAMLTTTVDDLNEGVYVVEQVAFRDVAGNSATAVTHTSLLIDRRAPDIINARIIDVPAGGYTDLAGSNTVVLVAQSNEALLIDGTTIEVVGANEPSCTVDVATLQVRCTAIVSSATPDGANTATLIAVDTAGNEATRSVSFVADTQAPFVITDSVEVTLRASNNSLALVATAGGQIELSMVVNEPLAAAPTVVLDTTPPLSIPVVSTGLRYTGRADIPSGIIAGSYAIRIDLADTPGHTSTAVVGDVTFAVATTSSCLAARVYASMQMAMVSWRWAVVMAMIATISTPPCFPAPPNCLATGWPTIAQVALTHRSMRVWVCLSIVPPMFLAKAREHLPTTRWERLVRGWMVAALCSCWPANRAHGAAWSTVSALSAGWCETSTTTGFLMQTERPSSPWKTLLLPVVKQRGPVLSSSLAARCKGCLQRSVRFGPRSSLIILSAWLAI
jgi:hypothetical protein